MTSACVPSGARSKKRVTAANSASRPTIVSTALRGSIARSYCASATPQLGLLTGCLSGKETGRSLGTTRLAPPPKNRMVMRFFGVLTVEREVIPNPHRRSTRQYNSRSPRPRVWLEPRGTNSRSKRLNDKDAAVTRPPHLCGHLKTVAAQCSGCETGAGGSGLPPGPSDEGERRNAALLADAGLAPVAYAIRESGVAAAPTAPPRRRPARSPPG